jgi:hypothetical protein
VRLRPGVDVEDVSRVIQLQRCEDPLAEHLIERLTRHLLHDSAQEVRIGVRVDVLGTGFELRGLAEHEAVQLVEREDPRRVEVVRGAEVRVRIVGIAAVHSGELPQSDPVTVRDAVDVLADRVVQGGLQLSL